MLEFLLLGSQVTKCILLNINNYNCQHFITFLCNVYKDPVERLEQLESLDNQGVQVCQAHLDHQVLKANLVKEENQVLLVKLDYGAQMDFLDPEVNKVSI